MPVHSKGLLSFSLPRSYWKITDSVPVGRLNYNHVAKTDVVLFRWRAAGDANLEIGLDAWEAARHVGCDCCYQIGLELTG